MGKKSYLIIIIFALTFFNANAGWDSILLGNGVYPNDVKFVNTTNGVIVANGVIFYSTDAGLTWDEGITTNSIDSLYLALGTFKAVDYVDENTILAVGMYFTNANTLVMRSEDGGVTWAKTYNSGSSFDYFTDVDVVNPNYIVSASAGGSIYYSSDKGNIWRRISTIYPDNNEIFDIASVSEDHRFVAYGSGIKGTQTDEWVLDIEEEFSTGKVAENIYAISEDTILYTSSKGIFLTENGGINWKQVDERIGAGISCINNNQFFCAAGRAILRSKPDNFEVWQKNDLPVENGLNVFFYNETLGFVLTYENIILRTTDGGGQYYPVTSFDVVTDGACSGTEFQFMNQGENTDSFQWVFNNEVISTDYNLSYIMPEGGNQTMTLIATGITGLKDTISKTYFVNGHVGTDDQFRLLYDDTVCTGDDVVLGITIVSGHSFDVFRGNDTIISNISGSGYTKQVTVEILDENVFDVKVTHECGETFIPAAITVPLFPFPRYDLGYQFRDSIICGSGDNEVYIYNTSDQVSYSIYNKRTRGIIGVAIQGDGSTLTLPIDIQSEDAESYYVSANHQKSGCKYNYSAKEIPVADLVHVGISMPVNVKRGQVINIENTSDSCSIYEWNISNGSITSYVGKDLPSIQFYSSGTDSVKLSVEDEFGCKNSQTKIVGVYEGSNNENWINMSLGRRGLGYQQAGGNIAIDPSTKEIVQHTDNYGGTVATSTNGIDFIADGVRSNYDNGTSITKYATDGSLIWSITSSCTSWENNIDDLKIDEDGSIYIGATGDVSVHMGIASYEFVFADGRQNVIVYQGEGFLMKVDKDGKFEWIKKYNHYYSAQHVMEIILQENYLTVITNNNNWTNMVYNYSKKGDDISEHVISFATNSAHKAGTHEIVLVGHTEEENETPGVLKIDSSGTIIWAYTPTNLYGARIEGNFSVVDVNPQTGEIYTAGIYVGKIQIGNVIYDNPYLLQNDYDGILLKLDADGNPVWSSLIDGVDTRPDFTDIELNEEGRLLVAVNMWGSFTAKSPFYSFSSSPSAFWGYIIQYDEKGLIVNHKQVSTTERVQILDMELEGDNLILLGSSPKDSEIYTWGPAREFRSPHAQANGTYDELFLASKPLVEFMGEVVTFAKEIDAEIGLTAYPNPFIDEISVEGAVQKIELFNLHGQLVIVSVTNKVQTHSLSAGNYFLKVHYFDGSVSLKKMVK